MTGLTPKQEKFARLVAEGKTYADAYRGAYNAKKCSANVIYVHSSKLMDNDKVSIRVDEIREDLLQDSKATLNEVLSKMTRWLRFDLRSIFHSDGTMKDIEDMTEDEAACIASFEVSEIWGGAKGDKHQIGELKKVKLIDKRAVSDQFMKHFGAYLAKVQEVDSDTDYLEDLFKEMED